MKLKDWLAVASLIILLTIGGWLSYHYYWTDQISTPVSWGTRVDKPMADQLYDNATIGFGFRYPASYHKIQEQLYNNSQYNPSRPYKLILILEDQKSPGQSKLILSVNQENSSERSERTLTLLSDNNGVYLADVYEDQTLNRDYIRTIGSLVMDDNNVYTWEFIFRRGRFDYQPDLESMLESFGIYPKDTTIDTSDDLTNN